MNAEVERLRRNFELMVTFLADCAKAKPLRISVGISANAPNRNGFFIFVSPSDWSGCASLWRGNWIGQFGDVIVKPMSKIENVDCTDVDAAPAIRAVRRQDKRCRTRFPLQGR